jgi:formyltetrahydrofolate-dependent phosphoribosylglycinamide formyltransferase
MLKRIGVLASGGGSNLAALYHHLRSLSERGAKRAEVPEIVLVASDHERAGALERAREWGVSRAVLAARGADAEHLEQLLREHRVDLIVLAGYLRLVPRSVVRAYRGRIINVHPALLPAYGGAGMYGQRVHRAVIEQGARVSGATVHFVDEEYDRGPIIAQWPVPVLPGDTPGTLAARVLRVEHLLLPRAACAVATGDVRLDENGRLSRPDGAAVHDELAFTLRPESDETIVEGIGCVFPDV